MADRLDDDRSLRTRREARRRPAGRTLSLARWTLAAVALSVMVGGAPAPGEAQAAVANKEEQAVLAVVHAWDRARLARDSAAFARPLTDDFTAVSPTGMLLNKAQVVAGATGALRAGAGALRAAERSETSVRLYGSTAVVTSRMRFVESVPDGQQTTLHRRATQVLVHQHGEWRIAAIQSAPIDEPPPRSADSAAPGAHGAQLVAGCDRVTSPPRAHDTGCFIVAEGHLPPQPDRLVFWQLRRFDRREQAEAARRPSDLVAEAEGSAWLFRFGPRHDRDGPGEYVATIGPLELPLSGHHHVVALYAPLLPGAYTPAHRHPGPEAWYVLEGEQCLETPAGAQVQRAGEGLVAPTGVPMQLTITGTGRRRALAVVVHDPSQPWSGPEETWQPRGLCRQER